jgi:hypothetical protein
MNRIALKAFAASILLSAAGAALAVNSSSTLKEIAGYREWKRINEKPVVSPNAVPLTGG